jgi:hypothetical protein
VLRVRVGEDGPGSLDVLGVSGRYPFPCVVRTSFKGELGEWC